MNANGLQSDPWTSEFMNALGSALRRFHGNSASAQPPPRPFMRNALYAVLCAQLLMLADSLVARGGGVLVVGSANVDLVAYTPRFPVAGETLAGQVCRIVARTLDLQISSVVTHAFVPHPSPVL